MILSNPTTENKQLAKSIEARHHYVKQPIHIKHTNNTEQSTGHRSGRDSAQNDDAQQTACVLAGAALQQRINGRVGHNGQKIKKNDETPTEDKATDSIYLLCRPTIRAG